MWRLAVLSLVASLAVALPASADADNKAIILASLELPRAAAELRELGVDAEEVRVVLHTARQQKRRAPEARLICREGAAATRKHGRVDKFGSFVQVKLSEGLRGTDLAEAIHAEHRHRGKCRGHHKHAHVKDGHHGKGVGSRPGPPKKSTPHKHGAGHGAGHAGHGTVKGDGQGSGHGAGKGNGKGNGKGSGHGKSQGHSGAHKGGSKKAGGKK